MTAKMSMSVGSMETPTLRIEDGYLMTFHASENGRYIAIHADKSYSEFVEPLQTILATLPVSVEDKLKLAETLLKTCMTAPTESLNVRTSIADARLLVSTIRESIIEDARITERKECEHVTCTSIYDCNCICHND